MQGTAPLPSSHRDFVRRAVDAVASSFKEGTKYTLPGSSKRDAKRARFAIAGNSSIYVQSGVSLLHVDDDAANLQLAPQTLYSTDAMEQLRQTLIRSVKRERVSRREEGRRKQPELSQYIAKNFGLIDGIFTYLSTLASLVASQDVARRLSEVKTTESFEKALRDVNGNVMKFVLLALDWLLKQEDPAEAASSSGPALPRDLAQLMLEKMKMPDHKDVVKLLDAKRQRVKKSIPDVIYIPEQRSVPASPGEEVAAGTHPELKRAASLPNLPNLPPATFANYVIARGICGHRGPHQASCGDQEAHADHDLPYQVPGDLAYSLQRADTLRHTPDECNEVPSCSVFTPQTLESTLGLFRDDFAIDSTEASAASTRHPLVAAREVRWQPAGEHAESFAAAAAIEHAISRARRLAKRVDITAAERALLLGAALSLKMHQLPHMHAISVALEDAQEPAPPPPLVTRPIGVFRGKMKLAEDAGHHSRPQVQTTETGIGGWTQEVVAQNRGLKRNLGDETVARFLAPSVESTGFIPAPALPTGEGEAGGSSDGGGVNVPMQTFEDAMIDRDYFARRLRRIVDEGLFYFAIEDDELTATEGGGGGAGGLGGSGSTATGKQKLPPNTPEEKRKALWNDALRFISIANDKVVVFVRTLSGLIGEDADSLLVTADSASVEAAKELQMQKKEMMAKVVDFQTKTLETLMTGVLKDSKLKFKLGGDGEDPLVIIDGKTEKELEDLASGKSGRPFFEANVALRSLCEESRSEKKTLGDVVKAVNEVASELSRSLTASVVMPDAGQVSMHEMAAPRNSYFIRLRDDTTAAIRTAYDRFCSEMTLHLSGSRVPSLWELVEGSDATLSLRFAEFAGHCLVSSRTSTGVSAMYASSSHVIVNATQATVSIRRLCNYAAAYTSRTPAPDFKDPDGRKVYFERAPGEGCGLHLHQNALPVKTPVRFGWIRGIAY